MPKELPSKARAVSVTVLIVVLNVIAIPLIAFHTKDGIQANMQQLFDVIYLTLIFSGTSALAFDFHWSRIAKAWSLWCEQETAKLDLVFLETQEKEKEPKRKGVLFEQIKTERRAVLLRKSEADNFYCNVVITMAYLGLGLIGLGTIGQILAV